MINDLHRAYKKYEEDGTIPFMDYDDRLDIKEILNKARYHSTAPYTKNQMNTATAVHYFVAERNGQKFWINVLRLEKKRNDGRDSGRNEVEHILYAVNRKERSKGGTQKQESHRATPLERPNNVTKITTTPQTTK